MVISYQPAYLPLRCHVVTLVPIRCMIALIWSLIRFSRGAAKEGSPSSTVVYIAVLI